MQTASGARNCIISGPHADAVWAFDGVSRLEAQSHRITAGPSQVAQRVGTPPMPSRFTPRRPSARRSQDGDEPESGGESARWCGARTARHLRIEITCPRSPAR